MATSTQLHKGMKRISKGRKTRSPDLRSCPQKKGFCVRVFVKTPRKPNSALRKVARVNIYSFKKKVFGYIRGMGHSLQKFSVVLLQGGKVKDLPGVKYRLIRGRFDFKSLPFRTSGRSKFGTKKSND